MRKLMRSLSQNWPDSKSVFKSEPSKKNGSKTRISIDKYFMQADLYISDFCVHP